jgi:hypothetical protein
MVAERIESNATAIAGEAARVSLEQPVAPKPNEPSSQPEPAPKRAKSGAVPRRNGEITSEPSTPAPDFRSPVPASRRSSTDAVVGPRQINRRAAGREDSSNHNRRHRNEANAVAVAGTVRTKTVRKIEEEVRVLLHHKLFGKDDAAKVKALRTLAGYFSDMGGGTDPTEEQRKEEYCRAFSKLDGCPLVLIALRQELDRAGGPNRDVLLKELQFLHIWDGRPDRRDTISRLNGVDKVVRAMEAFPNDDDVQLAAIACLCRSIHDDDETRRQELLEQNCLRGIIRAVSHSTISPETKALAMRLLERLCEIDGHSHVDRLIEASALVAAARAYSEHTNCDDSLCEFREDARRLMGKLIG